MQLKKEIRQVDVSQSNDKPKNVIIPSNGYQNPHLSSSRPNRISDTYPQLNLHP